MLRAYWTPQLLRSVPVELRQNKKRLLKKLPTGLGKFQQPKRKKDTDLTSVTC